MPIEDPSSPVLPLRDALAGLDAAVSWISPFAYLERVVEGVVAGAWRTVLVGLAVGARLHRRHDRPGRFLAAPPRRAPEGGVAADARVRVLSARVALLGARRLPHSAQAEEQLVYWPLVTDGTEYRRVPYPVEAGSLVVLADTEIVIEARLAPVSYWPITREYLADLSGEPELLRGSVEIVDGVGRDHRPRSRSPT